MEAPAPPPPSGSQPLDVNVSGPQGRLGCDAPAAVHWTQRRDPFSGTELGAVTGRGLGSEISRYATRLIEAPPLGRSAPVGSGVHPPHCQTTVQGHRGRQETAPVNRLARIRALAAHGEQVARGPGQSPLRLADRQGDVPVVSGVESA